MAQAIEDGLRNHGGRPEFCKVGVCTVEEREILEESRAKFVSGWTEVVRPPDIEPDAVDPGDPTRYHGCGMGRGCFFGPLFISK
jgi:hypothetical protein